MPNSHIVRQVYLSQLRLHQLGHALYMGIWDIQCILQNSGLSDIWESQLPNPKLASIKKHMELLYQEFWT